MANSSYKHFKGTDDLTSRLGGLSKDMRTRVIAIAVTRGARHVVRAAKRGAAKSRRTGALVNSIKAVTRKYERNGTAVAVVGPDRDYYQGGKRLKKGANRQGADRPTKYAHLVEFGHYTRGATGVSVSSSKGTSRKKGTFKESAFVLAQPFMRPAVASSAGAVRAEMEAVVSEAVKRFAK